MRYFPILTVWITAILVFPVAHAMAQPSDGQVDQKEQLAAFEAACEKGDMTACNNAGAAYGRGYGAEKSVYRAQQFYTKACLGDQGDGCMNLSLMYMNPKELGKDEGKARGFMEKGCELGSVNACANYASFLKTGVGGDTDLAKARSLSSEACSAGAGIACSNYGVMALKGEGGDKNVSLQLRHLMMDAEAMLDRRVII